MKIKILLSVFMLVFLLQEGAQARPPMGGSPLMQSIYHGNWEKFEATLKKVPDSFKRGSNNDYRSPLVEAARQGDKNMVKALLKAGANVLEQDREGNTALHYAVHYGYPDVTFLLTEKIIRDQKNHTTSPFYIKNNQGQNPFEIPIKKPEDKSTELSIGFNPDYRHGLYAEKRDYKATKTLVASAFWDYQQLSTKSQCSVEKVLSCKSTSEWNRLAYCPFLSTGVYIAADEVNKYEGGQTKHQHTSVCSRGVECQVECKEGSVGTYSATATCNSDDDYCDMSVLECVLAPPPKDGYSNTIQSTIPGATEEKFTPAADSTQ